MTARLLQGGLRGWSAAGLPVKPSIEYEGNALDSLNDTLQGRWLPFIRCRAWQRCAATGPGLGWCNVQCLPCRDPVLGPLAISLTALGSAAVYDVHRTLQFIGVFAFLTTLGTAPVRYSSKQVKTAHYPVAETLSQSLSCTSPSRDFCSIASLACRRPSTMFSGRTSGWPIFLDVSFQSRGQPVGLQLLLRRERLRWKQNS